MKSLSRILVPFLLLVFACEQPATVNADVSEITIREIREAYENGNYTIRELVTTYLDRIDEIDKGGPKLNSILLINPDVLAIADSLDQELMAGNSRGPLHGIPVILKDNIDTKDKMPNTAGALPMEGSMPLQDAFIVKKLRENGAVILGKANLSEWANFHSSFSSSGWSALGGQTLNPYNLTRTPCGSSSGSAVSVAANLTVFAIGTETNGSITCPSSINGIVGIKPTVGLLSRSGIIPISYTQDTPGPMTRTVTDAAIALGCMTGVDPRDPKTEGSEGRFLTDYTQFLKEDGLQGKKIGIYTEALDRHFRVDTVFNHAVRFIKEQGAEVVEIEELISEDIGRAGFDVLLYEFKDGLNSYFESLGPDAKVKSLDDLIEKTFNSPEEMQYYDHERLLQTREKGPITDEEYVEALAKMLRAYRQNGIDKIMDEMDLDAIIAPTRSPAWKIDKTIGDNTRGVSSSTPAATAGYPSVTVPMGTIDGLPVNISFFGRAWSEPLLLEMAYSYEQGTLHRTPPRFLKDDEN